jgi:4-alpha-glucanotransferase
MQKKRKTIGTLLPLFALQENDFLSAKKFLTWLKKTNQSAWLLLPLHEKQLEEGSATNHVPSPYKSYGIGLDPKYLPKEPLETPRMSLEAFLEKHKDWIFDYALFCSLRDYFGTDNWLRWDKEISFRDENTIVIWKEKLKEKILFYQTEQWQLHETYRLLHSEAGSLDIALIGDLPYYPSFRSPLVWAHQEVFQIAEDGHLPFVSGIPDTAATHFGRQIWGHPLYNWDEKQKEVITFWKLRLRYLASIFDHVRFDHAKAFFSYGVMDPNNSDNDCYKEGPGIEVFKELIQYAQQEGLTIFAEDSGDRTEVLRSAMNGMNLPGLRIFRFSLKGNNINPRYSEINQYPENCVAYTTTHDTETLLSYIQNLLPEQKKLLSESTGITYTTDKSFAKEIRDAIVASPANMVIIPIQDWLLTTDRINVPGTEKEIGDTNWQYRLSMPVEDLPTEF